MKDVEKGIGLQAATIALDNKGHFVALAPRSNVSTVNFAGLTSSSSTLVG